MGEPQKQLTFGLETLPRVLMFLQSFSEPLGGGKARGRQGCPALPWPMAAQLPGCNPASATACMADLELISLRGLIPRNAIDARASPRGSARGQCNRITVGRGCSSPPVGSTKPCQSLLNFSVIKTFPFFALAGCCIDRCTAAVSPHLPFFNTNTALTWFWASELYPVF